jgi:hypothetical protein
VRFGDIGDEAARSADDADLPLDLAAVRADDDLIEALSAGLVPPPSGPRDPSDVEGELVALLAGWVADVRPESLLHPPGSLPAGVQVMDSRTPDEDEPLVAVGSPAPVRSLLEYEDAEPVAITRSRPSGARAYLLRAAAGLAAVALIGSGVVVRSYDSHPGDSLWVVAKVVFPEKSRSVEAATVVSTALNTARVALESGRIDEARAAFQTVQDQLAAVDDADGRAELAHQRDYLTTQLSGPAHNAAERVVAPTAGPQLATGQVGATIPSSPSVTPGATQALLVPTSSSSSSVLAAPSGDPSATASGSGGPSSAAADGSSAPAVVAAPAPDPGVSAPPAASEPAPSDAASGSSAESPPVASPPPADPVTNPPAAAPSPEPPAPTSSPADPATPAPSAPEPPVDNGAAGAGGSDNSDNAANNSPAIAPSDPPSGGSNDQSGGSDGAAANKSSDDSSQNSSDSSSGGGSSGGGSSGGGSSGGGSSGGGSSGGGSDNSSGGSSGGGSDGGSGGGSDGGSGGGQESTESSGGGETSQAAGAEIAVDGLAGSTLGAVTGVVASTTGA